MFLEGFYLNTWRPAAFGVFDKKTLKRTWLCRGISPVWQALLTRSKSQKMRQVL